MVYDELSVVFGEETCAKGSHKIAKLTCFSGWIGQVDGAFSLVIKRRLVTRSTHYYYYHERGRSEAHIVMKGAQRKFN